MYSRHVFKTSSTRLQHNNFLSMKTSSRRLAKISWSRLENVLKTCLKVILKTCLKDVLKTCLKDVMKTSLEDVLKTSWKQAKCSMEIFISNHGLLTNLNQYLTNLSLTNLYFMNLRWIQNTLIRNNNFYICFILKIQPN